MAEINETNNTPQDYTSGLAILMGERAQSATTTPNTPEQDIKEMYDEPQEGEATFSDIVNSVRLTQDGRSSMDRYFEGAAAQQELATEQAPFREMRFGVSPDQQIIDPNAMIGQAGTRFERGLKAGWGDLVYGTGDTVDFISAWVNPGDPDPTTSLGSWLKNAGQEYQNDNVLVLSEDLQDMTFADLFKGEFWTSKFSRLLPYTLSFLVPYTAGARIGGALLGRYGIRAMKYANSANKTKKIGVIGEAGRFGVSGTGALGKLAFDGGRRGMVPTKLARNWSGYLGGGLAANMMEGAYLSGEAYNQMLSEVDDQGNPLFTPDEAANIASGVMWDNGKWAAVDVVQYGILFGGMGKSLTKRLMFGKGPQKVPFKESARGLTSWAFNKVAPLLPPAAAYASIEGLTEGMQETYQEWIKYTNIQEGKGQDYDSITTWIKDAEGGVRPEIRDIFWSSVGLGGAMGGARGIFDATAERNKLYNEKIDALNQDLESLNNQQDPATIYENEKYVQDNIIARELWNYYGDGSGLISYVNKQVKDGKMDQETADSYIAAIEEAEKSYEKHAVNTGLTEAGAKQAFFRETRLQRNKKQQAEEKANYDELVEKKSSQITDQKELEKALEDEAAYHEAVMNILLEEEANLKSELEMIYKRKKDDAPIAKSTGIRDKRYKVKGLSKDEYEAYTQEGAEEAEKRAEEETKVEEEEKAKTEEAEKLDIFQRAGRLAGKAVKGAKGLFAKGKEKATSEEAKKAIEDIKKYTKEKITPSAKEKLIKALEAGKIGVKAALGIIGTGLDKIINSKDVDNAVKKEERKKVKEETKEKEKPRYQDKQVPVKREEFTVTDEDGKVTIFRATTRLDGSVEWKMKADGIWIPATVIDPKVQQRDNISNEEAIKAYTEIKDRDTKTGEMVPSGLTYKAGKVESYSDIMNPKMWDRLTQEQKEIIDPKRAKTDVKKKDKTEKVVPKTKEYEATEKAIKEKGAPLLLKGVAISKGQGPNTYILTTSDNKSIKYQDFTGKSDELITGKHDIQLRLVEPVAGQANVVEVNGKLYFQFKKGAPLYSSIIEVVSADKVVGQLQYQDYKAPFKKAKKAKTKGSAKRVLDSIKETKENIQKLLNKSFDEAPDIESLGFQNNLEVYLDSGLGAYALTQNIMQKQFPGERGFVVSSKLIDDYGQESVALAIGSAVMINEEGIRQTDLIHELGHVYYSMMEGTPLMKRINKLLYKTDLFQRTREEYPELTLMNFNGRKMTLGYLYRYYLDNINNKEEIESDIKSIVLELRKAEKAKNSDRMNELFGSLRIQLKTQGVKEVRIDQQKHLLEETFTRTLEAYSYGTIDAIIKDSKVQEQLRKDLMSFYKKTKNLATDEEAKRFLDLSVDNIADLNLEAAIKHVLLDFNSGERTIPVAQNSAYSEIKKAKKKSLSKTATHPAIYSYIGDYIGRNLTVDQMTNNVLKDISKDSRLDIKDAEVLTDYIKAVITQRTQSAKMKEADKILDERLGRESKVDDGITEASEDASQKYKEENKIRALPTTTSHFIRKIVEVYNRENPVPIETKQLLHNLRAIAKQTMYDPYVFPSKLRESDNHEIVSMIALLDDIYKDPVVTNAKLLEIKAPIEGTTIETLTHGVLKVGKGGVRSWDRYKTISSSVENSAIRNLKNIVQENKDDYGKRIADVYNELFFKKGKNPDSEIDRIVAAEKILDILLTDSPKGKLINRQALINNRILFKGERKYLHDILFEHTIHPKYKNPVLKNSEFMAWGGKDKFVYKTKKYNPLGFFKAKNKKGDLVGQGELHIILTEGLVQSRAMNYLSMVDNVEQDGVSIMNKENGLHNRIKNIAKIIQDEQVIEETDIMHPNNNIYSSKLFALKQQDRLANKDGHVIKDPLQLTINSGLMRKFLFDTEGVKAEEVAAKLNDLTPSELLANDFFMFLSRYNPGLNKDIVIYDQAMAVFSDKSRRYYIESVMAHNQKMKNLLLTKIKNNSAYKGKYKNGERVFPFTIVERNGNLYIKEMPKLVKQFSNYIGNNKDLFLGNQDYKDIKNRRQAYDAFLTSYIANKFMAQQLFIHDHRQSKDQIDYIKRAAGAIASHTVYDRNTMVEPVVVKDYYVGKDDKTIYTEDEAKEEFGNNWEDKVAIENDAMGYVLPDQAEAIRSKYGEVQKVGSVFKFVYHYTEIANPKLKGKSTYLKFAVHTLTPEMEASSTHLRNIGNILRERHKRISEAVIPEFDGRNIYSHGNLVIAVSESGAKLFKDGIRSDEHIYDVRDVIETGIEGLETVIDPSIKAGMKTMESIMEKQDELYMIGDADSELRTYQGLSGEGLGIQLELDKQASERFFPSQLFYNLATNITTDEQTIINEMYALREKVMNANNEERNEGLITEEGATQEQVLAERESFKSSVSADVFGVLVESMYGFTDPRYPYLNAVHNSVATGRIAHKGTKMYTKGAIAYQSSSLGMELKSYQRASDYFNEDGSYKGESKTPQGKKLRYELEKIVYGSKDIEAKPDTLISEAIVPEYLKRNGVTVGSLFIGTRVPAHGKVSSAVFIVKDFHKQVGTSPTSVVTIPAWVSKYWGADLDGDSIHMNFKYTKEEVAKKQWRGWSNEFFDKYVDLVSKNDKLSELTADIDFIKDADNAIAERDKVLGKPEVSKESQLTPWGDAQMFEDNVPASKMVGMVAALQSSFNIFSNNKESLPFDITINGVKRTEFFDDNSLENGVGNWFGVAQQLNIVLDNAKHQYASKLGLNKQSVFSYVLLRRLGYSLNDLTVLFNSPVVKEYMEFKKSRGKNYISKDSDIDAMFLADDTINFNELTEFLKTKGITSLTKSFMNKYGEFKEGYNNKAWVKLRNRINQGIDLNIDSLVKQDKKAEVDAVLMLYALEQYNKDIVRPFSNAFTVHQSIEKNPIELQTIVEKIEGIIKGEAVINKKDKGGLNIPYKMGETVNSNIVTHALGLFNNVLNRASSTDIRFTPYMQSVFSNKARTLLDEKHRDNKSAIINQVVKNHLKQNISLLHGARDRTTLLEEFDKLKKDNEGNFFLEKVLEVVENSKGRKLIVINNAEINAFTNYKTLEDIRKSFDQLSDEGKNLIFELEFEFNGFGLTGTSFAPFFSESYMNIINKEMETIVKADQERKVKGDPGISPELNRAIFQVNNPVDRYSLDREISDSSRNNRTIVIEEPIAVKEESIKEIPKFKQFDASDITFTTKKLQNFNITNTITGKTYTIPGYKLNIKNQPNTNLIATQYSVTEETSKIKGWHIIDIKTGKKFPLDQTLYGNAGTKSEISYLLSYTINKRSILKDNRLVLESIGFDFTEKRGTEKGPEGPIRKPKKVIGPNRSYNRDYLGDGTQELTWEQWNADKGINIDIIDKESDIYSHLRNRYNSYLNDLKLAQEYISYVNTKKPLSKFTIDELIQKAAEFRKMDHSATKGVAEMLEKEIGQRAFKIQSEFLRDAGIKQGYKYNIPGEDGVAQNDISNLRKWFGSNNMTSDRPEIQYLINEAEKEYMNYIRRFRAYKEIINKKHNALIKSKNRSLTIIERVKQTLSPNDRYRALYGNITTIENGNIRLLDENEISEVWDSLSKAEREYYSTYKSMVSIFQKVQDKSGAAISETFVPNMQMGAIESMSKSGLFGLYNLNTDSSSYDRVKVYGKDIDGKRKLKTFYEWKHFVYKGRTKRISGAIELMELDKLRRKAKALKDRGKHEDGTDILLSDIEYDALVNNGAALKRMTNKKVKGVKEIDVEIINEYERRRGVSIEKASYDLNTSLLEFVRGSLFMHGDAEVQKGGFAGMNNLAVLIDAIIGFNKNLDNKNAVEYLTGWWKEGFVEGKTRTGIFGKTVDKVIDSFVQLASLRFLGFSMPIAAGNILAGKYQELRKRGGKQFVAGEKRFWTDFYKSRDLLKKYRIIEYSFDEFVHVNEKKGPLRKLVNLSFIFMDQSEHYIQGAAFLGMLTDKEFNTGEISDKRVRYINHKIATLHGEGYTALDASLLSMYSYGRALLQFKKWFITLLGDRYSAEDINRFGEVNIGSYRAGSSFAMNMFRKFFRGEMTMEQIVKEYKSLSKNRKQEIENTVRGLGLTFLLMSLIAVLDDNDDEASKATRKYLRRLQNDVYSTVDVNRFLKYRIEPSSWSTIQNTFQMLGEAARGEKIERTGVYGERGTSKALKTFKYEIAPIAGVRKDIANIQYK